MANINLPEHHERLLFVMASHLKNIVGALDIQALGEYELQV
jgi:hypothetical protein